LLFFSGVYDYEGVSKRRRRRRRRARVAGFGRRSVEAGGGVRKEKRREGESDGGRKEREVVSIIEANCFSEGFAQLTRRSACGANGG
jgi:hypothetical protein